MNKDTESPEQTSNVSVSTAHSATLHADYDTIEVSPEVRG